MHLHAQCVTFSNELMNRKKFMYFIDNIPVCFMRFQTDFMQNEVSSNKQFLQHILCYENWWKPSPFPPLQRHVQHCLLKCNSSTLVKILPCLGKCEIVLVKHVKGRTTILLWDSLINTIIEPSLQAIISQSCAYTLLKHRNKKIKNCDVKEFVFISQYLELIKDFNEQQRMLAIVNCLANPK